MMTYPEVVIAVITGVVVTAAIAKILFNKAKSTWRKEQTIKEWEEKMGKNR